MKPKLVCNHDVCLDPVSGLVKVDQIPILKIVNIGGELRVQFKDGVTPRVQYRGADLVEIPLKEFIDCINDLGASFQG